KTRLLAFGRFAAARRERCGLGKPATFDFLGFNMICGKSRSGGFLVQSNSRRGRMQAKLREIKGELRRRRHRPTSEQGRWLKGVVTGYFAYYAVPTNNRALGSFRHHVARLWCRSLRRRSQRSRVTWDRMDKLAAARLPKPR